MAGLLLVKHEHDAFPPITGRQFDDEDCEDAGRIMVSQMSRDSQVRVRAPTCRATPDSRLSCFPEHVSA